MFRVLGTARIVASEGEPELCRGQRGYGHPALRRYDDQRLVLMALELEQAETLGRPLPKPPRGRVVRELLAPRGCRQSHGFDQQLLDAWQ
jgi:hypothetical protein